MLEPKIASKDVLDYILKLSPLSEGVFLDIETNARKDHRPVVSKDAGIFLNLLVKLINAKNILEIGCNIGYSAMWFLTALPEDGHLDTMELSAEIAQEAKKNFEKAGVANKVEIHIGSAVENIPDLKREYDILFIDAAKKQYKDYLDLSLPKLRKGALILVDNVLWSGRVANENVPDDDKMTLALKDFNEYFMSHQEIEATILTVGDGLGFAIKK